MRGLRRRRARDAVEATPEPASEPVGNQEHAGPGRLRRIVTWPGRSLMGRARGFGAAFARGGPRSWDILVSAVAAVLFVVAWSTLSLTHDVAESLWPVVAAVGVLPLLLVRVAPFVAGAVWAVGGLTIPLFFDTTPGYTFPWQVSAFLVLLTLVVVVSVRSSWRQVLLTWVGSLLLIIITLPEQRAGWAFGITAFMAVGILLRWLVVSRRQLAVQTEEKELEQARRAVAEERTRIARDLHDVVAHRMSMVVVQAQSAQYRLDGVQPEVAEEFQLVADQAREALNEVRGMRGVLRSDGQLPEQVPQPGTADVERLLVDAVAAGLPLEWTAAGDPATCGEARAMVLYRILQESIANASRHAPGAPVRVDLQYGEVVHLAVVNGRAPGQASPGAGGGPAGHGIPGMQSRAAAVGGTVEAGPTDDGGFSVRVTLPGAALRSVG